MRTQYKNPAIHQAFNVLETLSADEETRLRVEAREKALKNAASELAAAREDGKKTKARETAVKLLAMGLLATEQIAEATGLSIEEVQHLEEIEPG
jgi:predicted transposase/invertase (TIGR01784 family)